MRVPCGEHWLHGDLGVPPSARGMVVFAHGSGSGRRSPRNTHVARVLDQAGLRRRLLIDLLTADEEASEARTAQLRFDIPLLAGRLVSVVDWTRGRHDLQALSIGLFGASTGAAAALRHRRRSAARGRGDRVSRRTPRPRRIGAFSYVPAPTLLIVGGLDTAVMQMNRDAMGQMPGEVVLDIVPGATHLFEEPGTLDRVALLAAGWFSRYLEPIRTAHAPRGAFLGPTGAMTHRVASVTHRRLRSGVPQFSDRTCRPLR